VTTFSQKERGSKIIITNRDFISELNNTNWYLKKIIHESVFKTRFQNRFCKKTNPNKDEEQELHFKDGIVEIVYKNNPTKILCRYRLRNKDTESHELFFIPIEPSLIDSTVYDVSIFNLSKEKLILFMPLRKPKLPLYIKDSGRLIFYKKP
jgi:hypothetical protein